jgi:hypothetical protein
MEAFCQGFELRRIRSTCIDESESGKVGILHDEYEETEKTLRRIKPGLKNPR